MLYKNSYLSQKYFDFSPLCLKLTDLWNYDSPTPIISESLVLLGLIFNIVLIPLLFLLLFVYMC